jgi:hypothetical protein
MIVLLQITKQHAPTYDAVNVVAGAWLTREKKPRTTLEVCNLNGVRDLEPMMITAKDLARTLGANAFMLVGDGEGFRVLERP